MKKKAVSIIFAGAAVLLAACGNPAQGDKQAQSASEAQSSEKGQNASEAQRSEPAAGTEGAQSSDAGQSGSDQVVETEMFSVTIPAEIAKLCEVDVIEDQIVISNLAARDEVGEGSEGGFVANISACESPAEYNFVPNEPGGVLTDASGKQYIVVAVMASDVQYGPSSEESYLTVSEAVPGILKTVTPVEGYSYTPMEEFDTDAVYADTLTELKTALQNGDDLEEKGFSSVYAFGGMENTGYAFLDLDDDGFDELLIGPSDWEADTENGTPVYDLFFQSGGKVYHGFSGGERDFLTVPETGYGVVLEHGSSGADDSQVAFLSFDYEDGTMESSRTLIYDGITDPENPYYISYSEDGSDREQVTEEEWNTALETYGKDQQLSFTPLSEFTGKK